MISPCRIIAWARSPPLSCAPSSISPMASGFISAAMLLEQRAAAGPRSCQRADGEEDLVGAAQIRAGVLDDAAELLERLALRLEDRAHARSSGRPPRSGHHATRTPLRLAIQRLAEDRGIGGIAGRDRGHRLRPSRSAGRPCRRPSAPSAPSPRIRATASGSGAVGTSPTVGRSATMLLKLAGLRSEPPRSLPSASGSRPAASAAPGAAARAARALGHVVRVQGRAVHRVVGVRAHAELGHVGLADRDRARAAQPLDQDRVLRRHQTLEDRRAQRERETDRGLQILERHGKAVQRADRLAAREPGRRHPPARGRRRRPASRRWR